MGKMVHKYLRAIEVKCVGCSIKTEEYFFLQVKFVYRQVIRLAQFRGSAARQYILSASISCYSHLLFEACSASIAVESHRTNWNPESDKGREGE